MTDGSNVRLRRKRLGDARNDYKWQKDAELCELDAASQLSATFAEYLADYTVELCHPSPGRHQFAIETFDGKHIGNCVYYQIDEDKGETELGIMIGNRNYWDKGYGTEAVAALVSYIFHQTDLNRVHLKTLDWNTRAQKCFKKSGFTPCGRMVEDGFAFELMELYREQWEKQQAEP